MSDGSLVEPEPPHTYSGRVHEFLVGEWRRHPQDRCPICDTAEWTYKGLYEVHDLNMEQLVSPGFLPILVIECSGCGYLAEISAAKGTRPVPTSLLSALDPCRPLGSSSR
jgi:hypothetical protein